MAIFCSQCGAENHQDAMHCYHCQSPIARPVYNTEPQGYRDAGYENMEDSHASGFQFRIGSVMVGAICLLYLLNPTAGFLEFIPDNIPVIGNLDEAAAVTGLLMSLSKLGIIPYGRR